MELTSTGQPGVTTTAAGVERVLLAAPRSFCAGVEMAIKALAWMVRVFGPPVYCYHDIVHNSDIVERFRRVGVVFVDDVAEVPEGAPLMLSAHGSAPAVVRAARERGGVVVDAVCPLVRKVHHEVRNRAAAGDPVVYVGHGAHDEAVGTIAVAPDAVHLVETATDVGRVPVERGPVALLAQTTLAVDEWSDVLTAVRERYGEVWVPARSDLCFATTNRQAAVRALAPRCDAVVVIGSDTSSNTLALASVAGRVTRGAVLRIDRPDELPAGLHGTVGVTAGASAPEHLVQEVVRRLAPRDGVEVVRTTSEDEYFPLPRELRELLREAGLEGALERDRTATADDVLGELDLLPAHEPAGASSAVPPPSVEDASVDDELSRCAAAVEGMLREVVESEVGEPWLRGAVGYHLGWCDEGLTPLPPGSSAGGGKRLRAALALLSYRAAAGADHAPALAWAAAVEMLHNFSLVHDDIEDGDRERRGRPSLWALCGEAQAINAGDCLFGLAFGCVGRLRGESAGATAELMSLLARTAVELTVGQCRDLAFEGSVDVDTAAYVEMVDGKTAALMRTAAYGGARLGRGPGPVADAFGRFGWHLGRGFQMVDDVLGIWGDSAVTGKPSGADLRRRKTTLPVVYALEQARGPGPDRLREIYAADTAVSDAEERAMREVLDRCGARRFAEASARREHLAASRALDEVDRNSPDAERAVAHLRALADRAVRRVR